MCKRTVLHGLRAMLGHLEVPKHRLFRTQDLRRGHTQDIVEHGGRLAEIYSAGVWKPGSKGYQSYLDLAALEAEAVGEAHDPWSSDDEGE